MKSRRATTKSTSPLADDPLWYKDAVIYEARVRSFFDSNSDGTGDFRGMTEKLDYLQELGITALWILPFYPSPLKDDGYDISEYTDVHPQVGSLPDFKVFMRAAHQRGIRVITELVLNHTSDQHPWFQRARRAKPGSAARNFYVWADSPDKYADTRIIFQDYETSNWTYDPVAKAYFWHRFFSSQPDLNFDNPRVQRTMMRVLEFWLDLGVDGLRLDAVPYLFEREGTNNENLPETHQFLKAIRRRVDARYRNRMLLSEANQWPEDAVAYFGDGDESHMAFHFPIMPRMFMSLQMEDRYPIIDILNDTPAIPESSQWALFLRNHDELTLEMVTDEERDYMYRVYAQDPHARLNLGIRRRLAPLLGNNRRKIELINGLLFSLPGTPIIYYGDEIGRGANFYLGDRNGVRTPMQWSPDRNAGFSRANPQLLYLPVITDPEYHYEAVNVETQQNNPSSLLWWMRRLIALRRRHPAFGRGSFSFLMPSNSKVLAFVRAYGGETILVVANLSRFVQYVELELASYLGMQPEEMFGRTEFPPIGELPYLLTLAPHGFYWFVLRPSRAHEIASRAERSLPRLELGVEWPRALQGRGRGAFEELLPDYLRAQKWFRGRTRTIRQLLVREAVPVPYQEGEAQVLIVQVDYAEGDPDRYVLPVALAEGDRAAQARQRSPDAAIAEVRARGGQHAPGSVLYDALAEPAFCQALLQAVAARRTFKSAAGAIVGVSGTAFRSMRGEGALEPRVLAGNRSNTTVAFGERLMLKVMRRLEGGEHPEVEISRFLTERRKFPFAAPFAGHLEFRPRQGEAISLGVVHGFVPHQSDAWQLTLEDLDRYFDRVQTERAAQPVPVLPAQTAAELAAQEIPAEVGDAIGGYLELARLLGQRTAEMHLALGSDSVTPAFRPEAFSQLYQRSIYQAFRGQTARTMAQLKRKLSSVPEDVRADAARILEREAAILRHFHAVVGRKLSGMRIRQHGHFHLGQVLFTGRDFVIIDFEGDPERPIGERRIKRSPLRDAAEMLRSFEYAAYAALFHRLNGAGPGSPQFRALEPWTRLWAQGASRAFFRAYVETMRRSNLLPSDPRELDVLLEVFLMEKALGELSQELNHRPDWVRVPVSGLLRLLDRSGG